MSSQGATPVPQQSFIGIVIGMSAGGMGPNSKALQIVVSNQASSKSFLVVADLPNDEPGTSEAKMIVAAAAYSKGADVKINWNLERGGVPVIADIQFPPT